MELGDNKILNVGLLLVVTLVVAKLISALIMPRSKKRLPPVIKSWPILGGLLRFLKGPVVMLREEYPKLGSVFTLNLLNKNITFFIGPEVSAHFFKAPETDLSQQEVYQFNVPTFGPGVVFDVDYTIRQEQFRFFTEALRVNKLKGYVDQMVMEAKMLPKAYLPVLILLIFCTATHGRVISDQPSSDLVSDGVRGVDSGREKGIISLFAETEEACEQSYGFLPCTKTALGNVFLIVVYGYLMFLAATYLSSGSELLLEILGPGLIGGLFLPALGALPDAMLILVSGVSGTAAAAQSQVSVGIGLLAGSTVMLLTAIWGTCCIVGKCDIQNSVAVDLRDTKGLSLTGSGVTTDIWTSYAAMIMAVSVIPFIVVQLPQLFHSTSGRHLAVLIALIISLSLLISYCLYQVFQPWIQTRRLDYVKHKHVISGILKHLKKHALGRLFTDHGTPNIQVIEKLFNSIDENGDGYLSHSELRALVVGISLEEINLDENDAIAKVLKDFDTSSDEKLDLKEFIAGVEKWLYEARSSNGSSREAGPDTMKYLDDFHEQTRMEHSLLGDTSDEIVEGVENPRKVAIKAALLLLLGTIIAAVFADPLVDAVNNFSSATSIPTFFISFIALPLATNSSEAVSAIIFASRKNKKSASLTFSELYGAVTMNNLLCLSVFLAIVYIRGLTWNFSSEVLVILIVCVIMGVLGSIHTTFPLWTCSIAFLLYPMSLVLVYVLDYVFGWS